MKKTASVLLFIAFTFTINAQYALRHSQDIRDFYVENHFVKLNLTAGLAKHINASYELGFANRFSLEFGASYLIPTRFPNKHLNNEINIDLNNKPLKILQTSNFKGLSASFAINFYLSGNDGYDNAGWYIGLFGKNMRYNFNFASLDEDSNLGFNKGKLNLWMPGFHTGYKFLFSNGLFTEICLGVGEAIGQASSNPSNE